MQLYMHVCGLVRFYIRINQYLKIHVHSKYYEEIRLIAHYQQ